MRGKKVLGWKDLLIGAIIDKPGNSLEFKTGDWRSEFPIIDMSKCINCLFCFIYCPDGAIIVEEGKIKGINMDYCKGCGICAEECPKKAIKMEIVKK